jgi:hypothetical protein
MEMHGEDENQAILNLQRKIDYSAARINTYEEELAMLVRERNAGRRSTYEAELVMLLEEEEADRVAVETIVETNIVSA